jgi:hypothetical protein
MPTSAGHTIDPPTDAPAGPGDRAVVMRLIFGAWLQQALYVAAKLDVADSLADGPLPLPELAARSGAEPVALGRFLRALVSVGVFAEPEPGRFALNGPAHFLRADVPDSHKYIAILHGEEAYAAGTGALSTVRTGRPGFEQVYGSSYFDYLAEHPKARAAFDAAMGGQTAVPLVLDQCDLGGARTVVDIGGGGGAFLAAVLARLPEARGTVFDLPEAVRTATAALADRGIADRAEVIGGSCFEAVPPGADLYTFVRVLHDFDDHQVLTALRTVRANARARSRLIVVDALLPETPGFNPGRLADLGMLMVLGGRYRTAAELSQLITTAGFEVRAIRQPPAGADPRAESAIEAVIA